MLAGGSVPRFKSLLSCRDLLIRHWWGGCGPNCKACVVLWPHGTVFPGPSEA